MSQRTPDTTLVNTFTPTIHNHPTPSIDPSLNPLPNPLTILIIGASRGIGASIAYAYAQAGAAHLVLAARSSSTKELATVQQKIQLLNPTTKTTCLSVDITSSSSVACLVQTIQQSSINLDILILNSGYSGPVVTDLTLGLPTDFSDVFAVNVQGTYLIAHHFIPLLKAQSSGAKTFIVVGSLAACITSGHIANTAYCMSKMAQTRLVEYIAEQHGKEGVLSVAVHPGAVLTEMADATTPESFRPYLKDDVGLCGAFCVWLTREKRMGFNGRLVSAKWDVRELEERMETIVEGDLLKFGLRV
ncbi:NAD(P)-binding protein [Plenodomus tracheiphilus IPT5]|uniref:NAD(P)-binding protein n=1 Tax=Plenodomus tracheiphilus IPT5 TaxID=1408161 RepID=A0A6A7BFX4_9PLEO|nr:NAD(P)-binding protein [Plenodomus tracheiphilus IPT5]